MARPLALMLALAFLRGVAFASGFPLQDGESLSYRVSWAIVRGAGEIKIGAKVDPIAKDALVVTTSTATRHFARMLLPFDAKGESAYDLRSGLLRSIHEYSKTRDKEKEHTVTFDHATRRASYVSRNSTSPTLLEMPPGDPSDLIIALLQTRTWDLKPGESHDSLVLFDDDFYELTIHAIGYEDISTPLGQFRTLVLEPKMEKTPPKGMFKRGSTVKVWIAQNEQRLPVRFAVEFSIGTGTATLEAYTPPSSPATPASSSPANAKNPGL